MVEPRLLVRSQREHLWRTALFLVPVALVSVPLVLIGAWIQAGALVVVSTLGVLFRVREWSQCGDLWDTGDTLEVRQGETVLASAQWRDVKHLYFSFHERLSPEWHGIFSREPALPRVTIAREGEKTEDFASGLPGFADLYLHSRSARRAAEDALAQACEDHGVVMRGRHTRPPRSIDWSSAH
ncbi:MAG TPA: hypothetical protein VNU26_04810 [Mycobacteriales bacterium]|nr:hypothetical protein [Mycobacteriales bacterium]